MSSTAGRHHVGLDIGACGVRAVELRRDKKTGEYSFDRIASAPLPRGAFRNGTVDDPKALRAALRNVWKHGRFTTRRVSFGVPNAIAMTRQVDLPWMPAEDFRVALRYQVGDVLPVDLSTVQVDYHPLDEMQVVDERGVVNDMNRILVVAADSSVVSRMAGVLESARLEPVSADTDAFALIRAARQGLAPSGSNVEALVDIGADHVTVLVHAGGQPRFVRTVANLGGANATMAIAQELGITPDEADQLKYETGLNGPVPIHAPIAESTVFGGLTTAVSPLINPKVAATIEVLGKWASTVIGEIRNSLDYFRATDSTSNVSSVTLVGSTTLLVGLSDRITTQLRLPVRAIDPLLNLPASKRVARERPTDARYVIAAGLAMESGR